MSFDTALLNLVGAGLGVVGSRQLAVSDRLVRRSDPSDLTKFISLQGLGRRLAVLAQSIARPLVPQYRRDPERVVRHIQQAAILLPDHAFGSDSDINEAWTRVDAFCAKQNRGTHEERHEQLAPICRNLATAMLAAPQRAGVLAKSDLDSDLIEIVIGTAVQATLADAETLSALLPALEKFAGAQGRLRANQSPVGRRKSAPGAAFAMIDALRDRISAEAKRLGVPGAMASVVATSLIAISEREQEVLRRLAGKIAEFKELDARLTRPSEFDVAVATLRAQAAAAIHAGRLDLADRLLAQAEEVDLNTARERVESEAQHMLQASESRLLRSSLEELRSNYRAAAAHCAAAASYIPHEDTRACWRATSRQAQMLAREADEQSDTTALEQAVSLHNVCLQLRPRASASKDWAVTQHLFGTLLIRLGSATRDVQHTHRAADACRAAADELIGQREPMRWAQAMTDYAAALHQIGECTNDPTALADALAAERETLAVFTRSASPQDWAQAQISIAGTLLLMAARDGSHHRLTEAVAAYRSALEILDADMAPDYAIKARIRLAEALCTLARRDGQPRHLLDAESVLAELPKDAASDRRMILEAGRLCAVRGTLELELGRRSRAGDRLLRAIESLEAALDVFTPQTMPLHFASAQRDVGAAYEALSQLERYAEPRLNQAISAYREAAATLDRSTSPLLWAQVELDLGRVLYALGMETGVERLLSEALVVEQAALDVLQASGDPAQAAYIQDGLAEKTAHVERMRRGVHVRR